MVNKVAPAIGANLVIFLLPEQQTRLRHAVRCFKRQLRSICPCQTNQKFKDSGCALSSTPSSILLSDLSNEQIRSLRKALLRSLLLKSCTRLQHPFVWHVSNSRVLLVDFSCSIALQIKRYLSTAAECISLNLLYNLAIDSRIIRSYPLSGGYSCRLRYSYNWD